MKIYGILFLLLIALMLRAEKTTPISTDTVALSQQVVADQTNLALRQLGHQLLLLEGNDSVAVTPIQQVNNQVFLLPIAQSFYYDTLPFLLHTALSDLGIADELYYVAVKDCISDTLILGYDVRQFHKGQVPCIGRAQYVDCNHIYVTFPDRRATELANNNWLFLLLIPVLIGCYFYYLRKDNRADSDNILSKKNSSSVLASSELMVIGQQSKLDVVNQIIYINNKPVSLTFRETKLLHYFVNHANQLLKREQLLEKVWEEEGVIVGRSLDVFVSRLRKILKADESLVIKTVHGVGYRLETKPVSDTLKVSDT